MNPQSQTYKYLHHLKACPPAMQFALKHRTLTPQQLYDITPRAEWLLWILAKHHNQPSWPQKAQIIRATTHLFTPPLIRATVTPDFRPLFLHHLARIYRRPTVPCGTPFPHLFPETRPYSESNMLRALRVLAQSTRPNRLNLIDLVPEHILKANYPTQTPEQQADIIRAHIPLIGDLAL